MRFGGLRFLRYARLVPSSHFSMSFGAYLTSAPPNLRNGGPWRSILQRLKLGMDTFRLWESCFSVSKHSGESLTLFMYFVSLFLLNRRALRSTSSRVNA